MSLPAFSRILALTTLGGVAIGAAHAADPSAKPVFSSHQVMRGPVAIRAELNGARELHLVVTDSGDGIAADWANWTSPVLIKADGTKIRLSDLTPRVAKAGWGKVNVGRNAAGKEMKVRNEVVTDGIGTHAPSIISYDLPEGIVAFEAGGVIDDGGFAQGMASVRFEVYTQSPPASLLMPSSLDKPYGFEGAKSAMERDMKVADGLGVSLFAAEPQIQNPTNIDIDHRGRVWAVEAVNYRSSFKKWGTLREEGDRVVILEDTNGDGAADSEKTFWQSPELKAPLGICVLPQDRGTHVIVSAAPNIWLLSDLDGDDKAEKATKLFAVGGNWDHDHQVHAFVAGPDGKFYFNFGNETRELKWPNGKTVVDVAGRPVTDKGDPYRQGMVFRCDIDLNSGTATNVETLGHNFRNNYEVTVDSFGTLWQSDNDDDGNKAVRINYVMEYGNYGYTDEVTGAGWRTERTNLEEEIPKRHWHLNDPGVVPPLLLTGGGSPTGILINEGSALGERFTNQLIHCDAGPRTVRAYPVENDGAGYKATMVDILTSNDFWFRPSDAAIAPDGSLYVSDWYDPGVGGHHMGDQEKGRLRGRIYRVSGKTAAPGPQSFATATDCAAALESPNRATQYVAARRLKAMAAQALPELRRLAKDPNPRFRARALALMAQIAGSEVDALRAGLSDSAPEVRIAAIRTARSLAKTGGFDTAPLEEDRALMGKLLHDPSPQVRREIAISLHGAKEIEKIWARLAEQHDGKDRWYLEALGIGAAGNEDVCLEAWLARVNGNWNTPAGRDILWRLRTPQTAEYLAKIVCDKTTPAAELPRFVRAFDFLPNDPRKTTALIQIAKLGTANQMLATEALQRLKTVDPESNPEVKAALLSMLEAVKGQPAYVELVRDFRLKDQAEGLLAFAGTEPATPTGIEAAKLLLAPENAARTAKALSAPKAAALIEALGNTADHRAVKLLQPLVTDASKDIELRKAAVRAMVRIQAGIQAMISLAAEGRFPTDLQLTAANALAAIQLPKFQADIAKHFAMPSAAGGGTLPAISALVAMKGDTSRGKAIFEKVEATCVTCHRVGNVGVDFGPGLSEIGSKLGKDALYEAIIAPNSGVSMGFETTQLTLKGGGAAMGIVRSETENELVLVMPGGAQNSYQKSQIDKREKLPNSLMPEGLGAIMPRQDLVDMVEYLSSLKAPASSQPAQ